MRGRSLHSSCGTYFYGDSMNYFWLSIVVTVYLAIVALLALYGFRATKNPTDYIVGGRNIHPYIMAMSYGATFISTSAIVGFGGVAALYGMSILWLVFLNIFVGIFVAFVFIGKRTRRMGLNLNAHTFPEFLGERFQSRSLQGIGGLMIFLAMPLYAAVVLMGGAHFISEVLSLDYNAALFFFTVIIAIYVVMGGLKGVMYTDAFQGTLMFIGMLFLFIFTYVKLGGVVPAHQALTDMKGIALQMFGAKGHMGWTAFPKMGSHIWIFLVTSIVLGVGIGVLAQPQLVVRFMTVQSDRELNRAVLVGGLFIFVLTGGVYVVGALSNVYFYNHPDFQTISFLAAGKQVDKIIPLYIKTSMPVWFTTLFMVTLLSAAMSTLSSQFHVMGTSIGRDIYEKWIGGKGNSLIINRMGILIAILISFFMAWGLPRFFDEATAIIARGTAIFFGLCAASFLPILLAALYSRKITKTAAFYSIASGFLVSFFLLAFMHLEESRPLLLCKALFGVDSLGAGTVWEMIDPIVIALPVSTIVLLIANRFGKPLDKKWVDHCFKEVHPKNS